MHNVLLSCGCRANSTSNGQPSCAVHAGLVPDIHVVDTPNLDERTAKCGCGQERPSSLRLAFFEYLGPGSPYSKETCECSYHLKAHLSDTRHKKDHPFVAKGPSDTDRFYCGHAGWD